MHWYLRPQDTPLWVRHQPLYRDDRNIPPQALQIRPGIWLHLQILLVRRTGELPIAEEVITDLLHRLMIHLLQIHPRNRVLHHHPLIIEVEAREDIGAIKDIEDIGNMKVKEVNKVEWVLEADTEIEEMRVLLDHQVPQQRLLRKTSHLEVGFRGILRKYSSKEN